MQKKQKKVQVCRCCGRGMKKDTEAKLPKECPICGQGYAEGMVACLQCGAALKSR